jgi:diadenosine tetraphosphate (Ap4A) HIT family hydrolase
MADDCVFCDKAKFGQDRIVMENENFFVGATIGQISDGGYLLLIPKSHVACLAGMSQSEIVLAEEAMREIDRVVSWEYNFPPVTIFEHGIVGQTVKHAHMHFIPAACNISARIRRDFPESEIVSPITLRELQRLYAMNPQPYLLWRGLNLNMSVCWNPPAPAMYLRIVVAEALGRPERANWRTMDRELDDRLIRETVARFRPHFL